MDANPATPAFDVELSRTLKSRHVSMIAIGGIIGAGLFVGSSTAISQIGPAVVLSYAISGFIILLVMRMLSEMAVAIPGVQSFPEFARLGLGHLAGFMSGWLYWYFWVVVVAIEAIAGARIIHDWFPHLPLWSIGAGLMAVLTAVNLMSTKSYGEFEFWFSSIKVAAIIVFILVTAAYVSGVGAPVAPGLANLSAHGGFAPMGWAAVLAGAVSTIFALCGAEIATIAAAESEEPSKVISRMTVSVTFRILVFYVLSIALICAIVPWNTIEPGISPFSTALKSMGLPGADLAMDALVLVAVLSCLNSGLYVTSRALFGLAKYGDAPQWLVKINARKVPARAILVASLFSYVALAINHFSSDLFSFLINACGATMLFIYVLLSFAQLKLRARTEAEAPERLQIKMWFHPFGTWFAIAAMLSVLLFMGLSKDLAEQLWLSLAVAGVMLGCFWVFRRQGGYPRR
jgi:GABA permease